MKEELELGGFKHFHFDKVTSTNDFAKELLQKNKFVLVTANEQTMGRGRGDNKWLGNYADNLYCSIGMVHEDSPDLEQFVLYQSLGCLAAKIALEKACPITQFYLKYPNDVYAKTKTGLKKICGVLAEHLFIGNKCIHTIIGIGINIKQSDFSNYETVDACSLKTLDCDLQPDDILKLLVSNISDFLKANPDELFQVWKEQLKIENKKLRILGDDNEWQAIEVLRDCRLKVKSLTDSQIKIVDNGHSIRYSIE